MSFINSINTIDHYLLSDGRIWSVAEARFVSTAPKDAIIGPCPDEQGNSTIDGLIGCLHFYNYPLGELKTDAEYASEVRDERDKRIAATDYLAMPDYPLTEERKAAVLVYRQALRDVPEQAGFPRSIEWPNHPFAN